MNDECYVESCSQALEKIVCNKDFLNDKSPQVLALSKDKQIDYHTFRYAYYLERKSQNLREDYRECMRSFEALRRLGVLKQKVDEKSNFWFVMIEPFRIDENGRPVLSKKFVEYGVTDRAIHKPEMIEQTT